MVPRVVYMVKWTLDISIEFDDHAFDDCYGEEQQDQEDEFRKAEENIQGVSSDAYGDIHKANIAAKKKFEELGREYLPPYKVVNDSADTHTSGESDNDVDEEEEKIVTLSEDDNKKKCWKWTFEGSCPYDNILDY